MTNADHFDGSDVLDAEAEAYAERVFLCLGFRTCPVCERPFHDHSGDEALDCMDQFAVVERAWPAAA